MTQLLRDHPDVAERLSLLADFEVRASPSNGDLLAPPRSKNYALVGTAFDYLLRWETERRNPNAKDRPWVATEALSVPQFHQQVEPELRSLYKRVVAEAMECHHRFVAREGAFGKETLSGDALDTAAKLCLCLAKVDPLFRSGTVYPDVNEFDSPDLEDMRRLYAIAPWAELGATPGSHPLLNPDFGNVSKMFRGADADLIVDTTLVDYKTVKAAAGFHAELFKYVPQLLGYVAISDRYRATENPSFPLLDRAGIYFARHGRLVVFPLHEVRLHPDWDAATALLFETAEREFAEAEPSGY